MEKTIREWFLEAKANGAEWADAAIKNTDLDILSGKDNRLATALGCAFTWSETEEGHLYWAMIHKQILDSEELPGND